MHVETIKTYHRGKSVHLKAVTIRGTTIIVDGSLCRTARLHHEWFHSPDDPREIADALRHEKLADLFTFWQVLPHVSPRFTFPMRWTAISALPITSYESWHDQQIKKEVRKNIKKAARRGVTVRRVEFDADLVTGITQIFNEAPVRQGKPFWHYGKTQSEVSEEMGQDLPESQFLGAYVDGELVGFYKLIFGDGFAQPVMSMSMLKHRDKYSDTALIAETVRICAERGLRYMTYGEWRSAGARAFLEAHGFTKISLPRYFVPLNWLGGVYLKLGAQKPLKERLPTPLLERLLRLRAKWYDFRYGIRDIGTGDREALQ